MPETTLKLKIIYRKPRMGKEKMAQWFSTLAALPGDQASVSSNHRVAYNHPVHPELMPISDLHWQQKQMVFIHILRNTEMLRALL